MKPLFAALVTAIVSTVTSLAQTGPQHQDGIAPPPAMTVAAQGRPTVEVVADLLQSFKAELARDALSCEVRRPASAGGIKQDALFEHPQTAARPARVDYRLNLPSLSRSQLLLLAVDIALSDGIKPGADKDGVRFVVQIDGRTVFSHEVNDARWQSHAVDLTSFAGRSVELSLVTDAIRGASYDWALWGQPRVLLFRNASLNLKTNEAGRVSLPISTGALAVRNAGNLRLRVVPDSGEAPVEFAVTNSTPTSGPAEWLVEDFNFVKANTVELDWDSRDVETGSSVWLGSYPSNPRLVRISATRAVVTAGDTLPLRIEVRNDGRGKLAAGEARIQLKAGEELLQSRTLPALAPQESWRAEWSWRAPIKSGLVTLESQLVQGETVRRLNAELSVFAEDNPDRDVAISNQWLTVRFVHQPDGFAFAKIFARQPGGWTQVAVWRPLFRIVADTKSGEQTWEIRPAEARLDHTPGQNRSADFVQTRRDPDGVEWNAKLRVIVESDRPVARVHYEWTAAQARQVRALLGPSLYVGEGTTGEAKTWGLFPGLEYLFGAEPSSNPRDFAPNLADRRTPHPHKITVPLMAVTIGPDSPMPREKPGRFFTPDSLKDRTSPGASNPGLRDRKPTSDVTVALSWNPLQRRDGEPVFPSARFASPNFDEGLANHRLGLFLASAPDFVAENGERAFRSYPLAADKTLSLDAGLVVASGPVNVALREYLNDVGGLPRPNAWPRSFESELDLCRAGFLKTLWNAHTERWSHCVGWAGSHAPGFAALLWLDSQIAKDSAARQASRERVELAVRNMLRDGGPGLFTSQANCHIMQWEFPFLYGYLPEALAGLENQVRQLIQTQQPHGGWVYEPGNAQQADLGQAGDSVLGTCANRAATLLRYARITGDVASVTAGEKALRFMEQFRVPRGGQTWECPMYEPDILAAACAVRAYHDGFRATGNPRWLHDAVYWAETGVPFIYLWSLPDKPMMLGATIPVFGSTFYTHTWLAVPVQWCGLVYACHVFHLARELEQSPLPKTDSPLPLTLNFSAADWRRIVELITVSGMYQQFDAGEKIGAYPDSISRFERRNPAFINPEDILVNVLALQGFDLDVKTARVQKANQTVIVSSGAEIENLQGTSNSVRFKLNFFPGSPSHSLIAGVKSEQVLVDGRPLVQFATPVRRQPGWWWDQTHQRTYLTVAHETKSVNVEIIASDTTARQD